MLSPFRLACASAALALVLGSAAAQSAVLASPLQNPDFEAGEIGQAPAGWNVPAAVREAGYSAVLVDETPASGRWCVLLSKDKGTPKPGVFGNVMQTIDATPFRGKRIRFRAAVRAEVSGRGEQAQLWLRVDRQSSGGPRPPLGFFDNMGDRPITTKTWARYQIVGDIEPDAARIAIGCMLLGAGRAWFDDATLEVLGDTPSPAAAEMPRPLSAQGLANVAAFVRLLGYVRYFHPSDETAAADWETFAIAGIRTVEAAADADALARQLSALFGPLAPSVKISRPDRGEPALLARPEGARIMTWQHTGLGTGGRGPSLYSSRRRSEPPPTSADKEGLARLMPFRGELGGGLVCTVPLAVAVNDQGTLPRPARAEVGAVAPSMPAPTRNSHDPNDRATRLAAIALAWNVLQHSYPYFDIAGTDWFAELHHALGRAATDTSALGFLGTLRRLIAALRDGHGNANFQGDTASAVPNFRAEWVEDQLVLTAVAAGSARARGLVAGDAIVSIDGRPARDAIAAAEAEISGATPQWIRYRATRDMFMGPRDSTLALEIAPFAQPGERRTVTVPRDTMLGQVMKRTGETITEVEPGVFYLDLDRATTEEFTAALPRLEKARGLVFDLRGYPSKLSAHQFFPHLTQAPLTSAQWHTPHITRPDRTEMNFIRGGEWTIAPKAPFLAAKRAFITDGRAISYAESCLGIVEHYKLGEIVGGATAGTNGNINTMTLPGGYSIIWTGMKVLKHDGSQHHGIGIRPTIPVAPTRAGVAAGRDELLDRAIQAVKSE